MFTKETDIETTSNELQRKLGKVNAVKGSMKTLHLSSYAKAPLIIPEVYDYYKNKKPIPIQDWGNNDNGDCTIASQGEGAQFMERQEQRKTVVIPKENIIETYYNMVERVYGVREDSGAYELDALNNWRNPDYTFKDSKGRPFTIDAYTKVNHSNISEVKKALYLSGAKGIKVCFALPWAWANSLDNVWDIPEGQKLTGDWTPYSWGGHSMWVISKWNKDWLWVPSSWNMPMGKISWRAFAIYADEAYMVVDSVNQWKKRLDKKDFNLSKLVSDVNMVSDIKIAA